MRISWHSFASRHLFFPTAHPLDNHRSDFKMFTTLVEPRAAGEWFHCKVLIPSVGTEAQIAYNKRNYTNKQLSPSGNSIVWFLQKDQNFLAFWRHFHVTKGIDHGNDHVISSIYFSNKLRTKLSDLKISRSNPVSFREIAAISRKVTNLHTQSCPETSASFHNYFFHPELPCVAVAQSANPSTYSLLWSDGSHRWVGSNPVKAKIVILSSSKKLKSKSKKSKWSRGISN